MPPFLGGNCLHRAWEAEGVGWLGGAGWGGVGRGGAGWGGCGGVRGKVRPVVGWFQLPGDGRDLRCGIGLS